MVFYSLINREDMNLSTIYMYYSLYLVNIPASGNHDSGAVETNIPDTETVFDWLN